MPRSWWLMTFCMMVLCSIISGCRTDTGEQSNQRLQQLGITVEEIGKEYVTRVDQLKAAGVNVDAELPAARKTKGADADRGGDPPEMPKTIAAIADNILIKLRFVSGKSKDQQVDELVKWLEQSSGKSAEDSKKLVDALKESVRLEPESP